MTDPLTETVTAGFKEFEKWMKWLQDNPDNREEAFALLSPQEQDSLNFTIGWMRMVGIWSDKGGGDET